MPVAWLGETGFVAYHPPPSLPDQIEPLSGARRSRPVDHEEKGTGGESALPFRYLREAYEKALKEVGQRRPAVLAQQIMSTALVTVSPDSPLDEGWGLIRTRGFHHLPVTSSDGLLVGMLSDRDLLRGQPNALRRHGRSETAVPPTQVRHLMSTRLLTASPDTFIRDIARAMVDERVNAVPILSATQHLVGMVTSTDILRCVVHHAPLDLWL